MRDNEIQKVECYYCHAVNRYQIMKPRLKPGYFEKQMLECPTCDATFFVSVDMFSSRPQPDDDITPD